MTIDQDARLKKLRFRAWRRGFREADLILGPFADKHVASFSDAELDWFEILLEVPDHDLYAWIVDREPTPPQFAGPIMDRIKAFRFEVPTTLPGVRGDDHGG
ncbi:MAG: succinate dehydrogenase assembly factor 2 [Phenylobacterium sp.]|nr:MAG: succinate dehydrogenase assembly factor 2 [Phenylobacterium sp.]